MSTVNNHHLLLKTKAKVCKVEGDSARQVWVCLFAGGAEFGKHVVTSGL